MLISLNMPTKQNAITSKYKTFDEFKNNFNFPSEDIKNSLKRRGCRWKYAEEHSENLKVKSFRYSKLFWLIIYGRQMNISGLSMKMIKLLLKP